MGGHQSRARSGTTRSGSDDKAVRCGTAAAFRAIDARNVNKLRKALSVGAAIGNARQSSSSDGGTGTTTQITSRSMSLLEYAVDKNYLPGVDMMLKVRFHFFRPPYTACMYWSC